MVQISTTRLFRPGSARSLRAKTAAILLPIVLCSCGAPVSNSPAAVSDIKAGDICSGTMGFDVSGPYYSSCKGYLKAHSQAAAAVQPAAAMGEHAACEQIGLAKGAEGYNKCVQEMSQLTIGAQHL